MTEADILERYGWTYDELDCSDEDRVYRGVALQNVRDSIANIKGWLASVGRGSLSEHDLRIMTLLAEAEKEMFGELVKPDATVSEGLSQMIAEVQAP